MIDFILIEKCYLSDLTRVKYGKDKSPSETPKKWKYAGRRSFIAGFHMTSLNFRLQNY